jgi:hypothetical protein
MGEMVERALCLADGEMTHGNSGSARRAREALIPTIDGAQADRHKALSLRHHPVAVRDNVAGPSFGITVQ